MIKALTVAENDQITTYGVTSSSGIYIFDVTDICVLDDRYQDLFFFSLDNLSHSQSGMSAVM